MHCKNCGLEIDNIASVCVYCGTSTAQGTKFCNQCGSAIVHGDKICMTCGKEQAGGKDWLTTLLLHIFLGTFGIHRFYTGNIAAGIIQLLTGCGCGIWWIVDLILIISGDYKDGNGQKLDRSRY